MPYPERPRARPRTTAHRGRAWLLTGGCWLVGCAAPLPPPMVPDCPEPVSPAPAEPAPTASDEARPDASVARLDPRDVRPPRETLDTRVARAAVVSQAPLTEAIVDLAIAADGRAVLVADGRGALALVDAETLAVRAARSVVPQPAHALHVQLDAEARHALVALFSSDPEVPHELYAWDLVTDELTRVETSLSPTLTEETIALAPDDGSLLVPEGVVGEARPRDHARVMRLRAGADPQSARERLPGEARPLAGVGFTPGAGLPYVLELDGGPPVQLFGATGRVRVDARPAPGLDPGAAIAFRPNGGQVAVLEADAGLALCSPVDGRCATRLRWEGHRPIELAYGLGGECLVLRDEAGDQALVDPRRGELVRSLSFLEPLGFVHGACTDALRPRPGGRLERVALAEGTGATGLLDAPAVAALGLGADEASAHAAASADGARLAYAVDGALVVHDVGTSATRARSLVGVPGPVTDVAFSPVGELFVRREGEVLRAGPTGFEVIPCPGDDPGIRLGDGTLVYGDACVVLSSLVDATIEGEVLTATTPDGRVAIAFGPQRGFVMHRDGTATTLWPSGELRCEPGEGCAASATMTRDGSLVALRYGGALRVVELRRGRTIASMLGQATDSVAFVADHRSLLVAGATSGLERLDLRTAAVESVGLDFPVMLGESAEISGYLEHDEDEHYRYIDARTHREVPIASDDPQLRMSGTVTPLRDGLFFVANERAKMLFDATRGRLHRLDGALLDAVRVGTGLTVALCEGDELRVVSMVGGVPPRRIGTLGGCSRIRRATLRDDGGAIAVAAGDAALLLPTPGDRPPLLLRTQIDLDGDDHPIAILLGGGFEASDAIVEALRVRRAGPVASAPLDPAVDHPMRRLDVHLEYFGPAAGPRGRAPARRSSP